MSNKTAKNNSPRIISPDYKKNKKKIGENFGRFRYNKDWTLQELSIKFQTYGLYISTNTLNCYENGTTNIAPDVLFVLGKYFHVDLNELICGEPLTCYKSNDPKYQLLANDLKKLCISHNIKLEN